jgi:hypothetical protein
MARALRLGIPWAFAEHALARVQAFVSLDNEPSARLLERLGFVREGVLRSYRGPRRDRVAFSILPDELTRPIEPDGVSPGDRHADRGSGPVQRVGGAVRAREDLLE